MNDVNIINECNDFLRSVINYYGKREESFDKQLSFLKMDRKGWRIICSCLDVICDTESSKSNYYKYGLSGPTKIIDNGEELLRLYGILSAIYLQLGAIIDLLEVLKITDKKKIISDFKELDIIFLRNALSSHTTNFIDKNGNKVALQYGIYDMDSEIIICHDDVIKKYILRESIVIFDDYFKKIYVQLIEKYIRSLYKNHIPNELNSKYIILKHQIDGNIVMQTPGGEFIVTYFE